MPNRQKSYMSTRTSKGDYTVDNKASVIKLVNLYSNIKMMHGPIRIKKTLSGLPFRIRHVLT